MHHANLIIGNMPWALSVIPPSHKETCADVTVLSFERMSIADVRTLIHGASLTPFSKSHRVFIIFAGSILTDAQNALLKLFEEPNAQTVFYLIIPREDMLILTLRSRCMIFAVEEKKYEREAFNTFLKSTYAERLHTIEEQLKNDASEWVRDIVEGFSYYAHMSQDQELLRDALMLEAHIYTNGSAKKMLLEHVALTLPKK